MRMREGIILAGGFGTRLQQVVSDVPKPLAPVAGRLFLEILLSHLIRKGFSRFVLSLGYMADKIIAHFGDNYSDARLIYEVEEQPLGTGGATRAALQHCTSDHVFVFNGDTYLDLEIDKVECLWQKHRMPIIVGKEVPDTARYGRLLTEHGHVTGFTEKGIAGIGLINAGCYVLNQGQLDSFPSHTAFSLETDYFAKVAHHSTIDLFVTAGQFIDIGVLEDYERAQSELRDS